VVGDQRDRRFRRDAFAVAPDELPVEGAHGPALAEHPVEDGEDASRVLAVHVGAVVEADERARLVAEHPVHRAVAEGEIALEVHLVVAVLDRLHDGAIALLARGERLLRCLAIVDLPTGHQDAPGPGFVRHHGPVAFQPGVRPVRTPEAQLDAATATVRETVAEHRERGGNVVGVHQVEGRHPHEVLAAVSEMRVRGAHVLVGPVGVQQHHQVAHVLGYCAKEVLALAERQLRDLALRALLVEPVQRAKVVGDDGDADDGASRRANGGEPDVHGDGLADGGHNARREAAARDGFTADRLDLRANELAFAKQLAHGPPVQRRFVGADDRRRSRVHLQHGAVGVREDEQVLHLLDDLAGGDLGRDAHQLVAVDRLPHPQRQDDDAHGRDGGKDVEAVCREDGVGDDADAEGNGPGNGDDVRQAALARRRRPAAPEEEQEYRHDEIRGVVHVKGRIPGRVRGRHLPPAEPAADEIDGGERVRELAMDERRRREEQEILEPGVPFGECVFREDEDEREQERRGQAPADGPDPVPEEELVLRVRRVDKGVRQRPDGEAEAQHQKYAIEPRAAVEPDGVDAHRDIDDAGEEGYERKRIHWRGRFLPREFSEGTMRRACASRYFASRCAPSHVRRGNGVS